MSLYSSIRASFYKYPEHISIKTLDGQSISYRQLDDLVQQYAQYFTKNFSEQSRIGMVLSKSPDAIAAMLGLILSNMVYVPMDCQSSANRMAYIAEDCEMTGIIGHFALLRDISTKLGKDTSITIHSIVNKSNILILDESLFKGRKMESGFPDLAMVIYTSGSTGFPKGVMLTDDNVYSFVQWASSTFEITSNDCLSSLAMLHFDLSVFDILASINNGASVVLFSSKDAKNPMLITSSIQKYRITVCYATPSLFRLIFEYGKPDRYDCSSLRCVLFAGEIYPPSDLSKLMRKWESSEFYNLYGPTETNVVTYHRVEGINHTQKAIPIGLPCSHVIGKLNEDTMVEKGKQLHGELMISGRSVTPGYWNGADSNTSAFKYDNEGVRWYKTGDWVYVDENGKYIFVGRRDRMVKKNGYRIELDEIERNLLLLPSISDAAVISKDGNYKISLVAFVDVADTGERSSILIKQELMTFLPQYMVPDLIVFVGEIPKTSTFKTDYQKLKANEI